MVVRWGLSFRILGNYFFGYYGDYGVDIEGLLFRTLWGLLFRIWGYYFCFSSFLWWINYCIFFRNLVLFFVVILVKRV